MQLVLCGLQLHSSLARNHVTLYSNVSLLNHMCHWLMQHMRQPIPCQTVVYSTHTTAYVWIVCAQYKVQPTLISGQVPVVGALRIYFCSNLRVDKANKPKTNL